MRHPSLRISVAFAAVLTLALAGTGEAGRGESFDVRSYFEADLNGKVKVRLPGKKRRSQTADLAFAGAGDRWWADWNGNESADAAVRRGKRTLELGPSTGQQTLAEHLADGHGVDLGEWDLGDVEFAAKVNRRGTRVKLKGSYPLSSTEGKRRRGGRVRIRLKGPTTHDPVGPPSVRSPITSGTFLNTDGLVALPDGGVTVHYELRNDTTFGVGDANETVLSPGADATDVVLARYAPDGSLDWLRRVTGEWDRNAAAACLPHGRMLFVLEDVQGALTLSAGEPDQATEEILGSSSLVMAVYDADGSLHRHGVLAEVAGSELVNNVYVRALPDGSFYLKGRFEGALTFNPGAADALTVEAGVAPRSYFVAYFGADGTIRWVRRLQADWMNLHRAMSVRADGGIRVCVRYDGTLTVDRPESTPFIVTADTDPTREFSFARDGTFVSSHLLNDGGSASVSMSAEHPDGSFTVSGSGYRTGFVPEGTPPLIGPGSPNATELPDVRARWIARYEGDGTLRWVRFTDELSTHDLIVAPAPGGGLHLVAGLRDGEGVLSLGQEDATTLADPLLTSEGQYAVRAHYAEDGTLSGVRPLSSGGLVRPAQIDSRPDGSLVLFSYMESTDGPITFDLDGRGTTADVPQSEGSSAVLRLDAE